MRRRLLWILVMGMLSLCRCAAQPTPPTSQPSPPSPPLIADVPLLVTTYVDSNGNRQKDSADLPLAQAMITLITATGTTTTHRSDTDGRMLLDFAYQMNGSGADVFPITVRVTSPDPQRYIVLGAAEVQVHCCNPQASFLFLSMTPSGMSVEPTISTTGR